MNERLRELAEQAGFIDKGNNHTTYMNFDHEKFAELIVEECAMLQEQRSRNRHGYDKYEDAVAIKQHFEVKS